MTICRLASLELLRLIRRSNVIFLFLCAYVLITPVGRALDQTLIQQDAPAILFYSMIINSTAPFALLLSALFMVNNVGNELQEGALRKLLSLGLTKNQFLTGKFVLVCLLSLIVIFSILLTSFGLGLLLVRTPFYDLLQSVSFIQLFNMVSSLIAAGMFGLSCILLFRSRAIGLVFFPFWASTELVFYLLAKAKKLPGFIHKLPGQLFWQTFNSHSIEPFSLFVLGLYTGLFFLLAWAGLYMRDVR